MKFLFKNFTPPPYALSVILMCIILFPPFLCFSQENIINPNTIEILTNHPSGNYCNDYTDTTFKGAHSSTACENQGETTSSFLVGSGTPYPKASDIPGSFINSNTLIEVVGDLRIDVNFSFVNNTIRVYPYRSIKLDPNIHFTLDNSDLFACDALWSGIHIDNGCVFTSMNNTTIEDAFFAVYIEDKDEVTLDISRTLFNRNLAGIGIINSQNSPNFVNFRSNEFTCTAPINGTLNGITFAGITCAGGPLDVTNSYLNRYNRIQYGVIGFGESTAHSYNGRFDFFEDISNTGISFDGGSVELSTCFFTNCSENGLYFGEADQVIVKQSYFSTNGESVSENSNDINNIRYGIHINNYKADALLSVKSSSFSVENFIFPRYRGIYSNCTFNPAKLSIFGNTFNIKVLASAGIYLSGSHSPSGEIDIENNSFNFSDMPTQNGGSSLGIKVIGSKHNMAISANNFNAYESALTRTANGISLLGSSGANNSVEGNTFYSEILNSAWVKGIEVINFENTGYCNNTNLGGSNLFWLSGQLINSEFTSNTTYFANLFDIFGTDSFIGENFNTGNQFNPLPIGNEVFFAGVQSKHEATDQLILNLSKFTVHQSQTINYENYPDYSSFHPATIIPDINNEWWEFDDNLGDPELLCQQQRPAPEPNLIFNSIASGDYAQVASAPASWNAEMGLYRNLIKNDALMRESNLYQSFMTEKIGSNIEAFFKINDLLEQFGESIDNTLLLNQANTINNNVAPELLLEENLKQYYSILVKKMLNNEDFSESDKTSLLNIASQCPVEGGIAVYLSRVFTCYEEFNDFSDDCLGEIKASTIVQRELNYSEPMPHLKNVSTSRALISPNPINGNQFTLTVNQGGVMQIFTVSGQLIEEFTFDGSTIINAQNIPIGVSFYSILYNDGESKSGKLIKQ